MSIFTVERQRRAEAEVESQRQELQQTRDTNLQALTHTLLDGSVYQTRPQDMQNFDLAIALGQDREWVLADNSIRITTVAELQDIRGAGIANGQTVWDQYIADLKLL